MEIGCRVYKPRRPRDSPLFRLVERHLEELLRVWPERDTVGQAELHDGDTDVWYVIAGGATLVTGGTIVDAAVTGPGEQRGRAIRGGAEHAIAAGDVITIRPGVAHWVKALDGRLRYLVVKVHARPASAGTAR